MSSLLLKNATLLVTMDHQRRNFPGGGLFIRDGVIDTVGSSQDLPTRADSVIDATGLIVMPGLVNVHHHFSQNLTRALPEGQNEGLFGWLDAHYPIWARIGPEEMYVSALVAMAELLLSGCTTTGDFPYMFPNGSSLDDEIRAAQELGIRFHPCRGSMTYRVDPQFAEDEDHVLQDTERIIQTYHNPSRYSMCRISLGPVVPDLVSEDLLINMLELGRRYGIGHHTHVGETVDGIKASLEYFGQRTVSYLAERGWVGPDVWYAHCVHINDQEMDLMVKTGTGVAHCPSANMRLGNGIAPIRQFLDKGVNIGIAVDGSAGSDSGNLLAEVRLTMLAQRAVNGPKGMTAHEALELATLGGATVLCRDDIGSLEPGKAADLIGINFDRLEYAGAAADPFAALAFCAPVGVDVSIIDGKVVVEAGQLVNVDLPAVLSHHKRLSQRISTGVT